MTGQPLAISFLVIEVARLIRQEFELALEQAGIGITAGEARTLYYVNRSPGERQTAIAEQMHVEPMTLVGFLDKLEARGLIERTVDPNDRRAKTVRPTKAAEPLVRQVEEIGVTLREMVTADLDDRQTESLRGSLAKMREVLVRETGETDTLVGT